MTTGHLNRMSLVERTHKWIQRSWFLVNIKLIICFHEFWKHEHTKFCHQISEWKNLMELSQNERDWFKGLNNLFRFCPYLVSFNWFWFVTNTCCHYYRLKTVHQFDCHFYVSNCNCMCFVFVLNTVWLLSSN